MSTYEVQIQYRTRAARVWLRLMRIAAPLAGGPRAMRWAAAGWWRLVRYRFGKSGAWLRLPRPEAP